MRRTSPGIHADVLKRRIKENEKFLKYLNLNIDMLYQTETNSVAVCFLVIDDQGCLLHVKGDSALSRELALKEICEGTLWSTTEDALHDYVIYRSDFMPGYFSMHGIKSYFPFSKIKELAVIVRKAEANPSLQYMINALNACMIWHMNFDSSVTMSYIFEGAGQINIDQGFAEGVNTISYCNEEALSILKNPDCQHPNEAMIKPLEELIDPLPDNETFWTIINGRKQVKECSITLQIRGKALSCMISTDPFQHPAFHSRGVVLKIETPEKQGTRISGKIANSAIMTVDDIVGESMSMRTAVNRARILAQLDGNILLTGESGVGKDVFAQAIHNMSKRRGKPFIAVNCGSIPRDLIASELFGYAPGAFTGARKNGNIGKFELANGGTIFLDEIGELPFDMQANLLRVVEQKHFMRVGGTELIRLDVKIISATNADLRTMVERKQFREDLFYRLNTLRIQIPPLRKRGQDIILLAQYFLRRTCEKTQRRQIPELTGEAQNALLAMPWFGNVRELQNLMECLVLLIPEDQITAQDILSNVYSDHLFEIPDVTGEMHPLSEGSSSAVSPEGSGVRRKKGRISREEMLEALEKCRDNRSQAAEYLHVPRSTFYRYLEIYRL